MRKFIGLLTLLILFNAGIAIAGYWQDWQEEALLHDGRVVLVERRVTFETRMFCGDFGQDMFCNAASIYMISFEHPDTKKKVVWQGDYYPVALYIINKVPYLVAVGLRIGQYPICNGIPYFYYRYELKSSFRGSDSWKILDEPSIPKELTKANLTIDHESRRQDILITHEKIDEYNQWTEKHNSSGFVVTLPKNFHEWNYKNKWFFAADQRRWYKGKEGCKDIKPLPDPEMEESRRFAQQLEDSAKTVVGTFIVLDETPETLTQRQYAQIKDNWLVWPWLKPSCKGVVDNVSALQDLKSRYAYQLTFSTGKRAQLNWDDSLLMSTCFLDMVYVIRRKDYDNFIINRYRASGEIIDVTKVSLQQNKMPHIQSWQELFRVYPLNYQEMIMEFTHTKGDGCTTYGYTTDSCIAVWKAKFKVEFPTK